jgi:hypothetical protein
VPLGSHTSLAEALAQRLVPGVQMMLAQRVPRHVSPEAHAT